MLIVRIKAGLGNQMFQYAFGRAMSLRRKETLFLDLSAYDDQASRDTIRHFELDHFNIQASVAGPDQIFPFLSKFQMYKRKIERKIFYSNSHKAYKYLTESKASYFEGWFQNEEYFKEIADNIRDELTLKEPFSPASRSILQSMENSRQNGDVTVSLHVRRGDYVSNTFAAKFHGTVGKEYYEQAIEMLRSKFPNKKISFFIFSDDIEWVSNNIAIKENIVSVSRPEIPSYEEIHLMSLCDHHIIANSSFSWWGAWLDPKADKLVIAPKKWVNDDSIDTSGATPPSWHRI